MRSINEYDVANTNWRGQNQGTLLITQITQNMNNFEKWMIQMKLANIKKIKIASVSR